MAFGEADPSFQVSQLVKDIVHLNDFAQDANDSGSDEYLSSEEMPIQTKLNGDMPLIEMVTSQRIGNEQSVETNSTFCVSVTGQELEWDVGCMEGVRILPENVCEHGKILDFNCV